MYRDQEQRDFARGLRNDSTPAEKRLWHFLRAGNLGVKFRRQAAIGAYIVDFVCFSCGLIVELDGPQHAEDEGKHRDARRTAWLVSRGFRVIRFRNQALDDDIWLVVEEIKRALSECSERRAPLPNPPRRGGGSRKNVGMRTSPPRGRESDMGSEPFSAEGREPERETWRHRDGQSVQRRRGGTGQRESTRLNECLKSKRAAPLPNPPRRGGGSLKGKVNLLC